MAKVPAPIARKLHDVVIVSTKKLARARVVGVPPEEFGIERQARSIADCNYCFHQVVTKTEADLIDEGFDADQIKSITEFTGLNDLETVERDTVYEHQAITGSSGNNPSARIVLITEHYVRMDYEGNGRPALHQVITGGDQGIVLKKDGKECIEKFDKIPFAAITPVPQPHRFFGRSIADLVLEEQREKTALKRGLLDNIYLHNNQRFEVGEEGASVNTLDDLLVSRPGGVIRTKRVGSVAPIVVQDVTAAIYPALQYLDAVLESKTGLQKQTQGIDANALQNQSATAVAQVFSASQMRIKLVARIFAEGVKDIFSLLHATIRKHGEEANTVRLRNKWVSVDPRNWKTRDDMTINVGLGNGSKAQQFAMISAIAGVQEKLLMGGKANLVDDMGLFNTAAEMTKIMGHKNPDKFFNDPSAKDPQTGQLLHPPVPPPPDPKLQIEQMKAQNDAQTNQQKALLERQKAENDAQHQLIKTQSEIELSKQKADLEAKLALIQAELERDKHMREQSRKDQEFNQKITLAQQAHEHALANPQAASPKSARTKEKTVAQVHSASIQADATHKLASKMDAHTEALLGAIKEMNRPKRIVRDKNGRVSHTEVMQ